MSEVVFLLGAGASKDAGLPDVKELVASFRERGASMALRPLLTNIENALFEHGEATIDVELLLATLDQLIDRDHQPLAAFVADDGWDAAATAPNEQYVGLHHNLEQHIRNELDLTHRFDPEAGQHMPLRSTEVRSRVEYLLPLVDIGIQRGGIDVFSLNYDLAIETACLTRGVRYTDGFDPS